MESPIEKAQQLISDFGIDLAYKCTEEIIGALYDEGNRQPQYWYDVQTEINNIGEQNK